MKINSTDYFYRSYDNVDDDISPDKNEEIQHGTTLQRMQYHFGHKYYDEN